MVQAQDKFSPLGVVRSPSDHVFQCTGHDCARYLNALLPPPPLSKKRHVGMGIAGLRGPIGIVFHGLWAKAALTLE